MRPSIFNLPLWALEQVGLNVAVDDAPGLPQDLVPFLQTCKHVYSMLSFRHNSYLYARLFRIMFDTLAVRRRFGDEALYSPNLSAQLRSYCRALACIRALNFEAPADVLWQAFFMVMENDGRNQAQLEKAGLRRYVDGFVRQKLLAHSEENHGWPAESTVNALALCLMWHTSDYDALQHESADTRREVMELIRPFVVNPVRYAPFHTPDNHFVLPVPHDFQHPYTHRTPQGLYPPYRNTDGMVSEHEHFGQPLCILQPSASLYAKLVYFSRLEAAPFPIPTDRPEDRAAAHALGLHEPEPTREDFRIFNTHKGAAVVARRPWDWFETLSAEERRRERDDTWSAALTSLSAQQDLAWNRMCFCHNPRLDPVQKGVVYSPGSIAGQWMGRLLMPDGADYFSMIRSLRFVPQLPRMVTLPVSFRLREHHCISPNEPLAHGGAPARPMLDDGVANGWLPEATVFTEHAGLMRASVPHGPRHRYETFRAGCPNTHDERRCTRCRARRELENEELAQRMAHLDTAAPDTSSGAEVAAAREGVEAALGGGVSIDAVLADELRPPAGADGAPPCNGIRDIVITGESLPQHGAAWHAFRFYGRVRRWDGLVALVRVPAREPALGVAVFRGYLVAHASFVGTWRAWTAVGSLPLEGPFTASRAPAAE